MKKVIIIIGSVCIVGLIVWIYLIFSNIPNLTPKVSFNKVYSSSINESVFLRKESRGLNYEVIAITKSSLENYEPNPEKDYIFPSSGTPIFYLLHDDTLFVHTYTIAKIPVKWESQIKIKQIELSRSQIIDYQKSFKSRGFKVFPDSTNL